MHDLNATLREHLIARMADLVDRYAVYLLDSYGVLHDGRHLFEWAEVCLNRLLAAGKAIHILTNTPRRADMVARELDRVGLHSGLYQTVTSAGETTYRCLEQAPPSDLGEYYYYIGPERSRDLLEGLSFECCETLSKADWLLLTGVEETVTDVKDYDRLLTEARSRGLPAVCANPDRVAIRGGVRGPCAGTVAERFEGLGGSVHYFGKPFPNIYKLALERANVTESRGCLAVGDGLYTDIQGAQKAGIADLFIVNGIHGEQLNCKTQSARIDATAWQKLKPLFAEERVEHVPMHIMARFEW